MKFTWKIDWKRKKLRIAIAVWLLLGLLSMPYVCACFEKGVVSATSIAYLQNMAGRGDKVAQIALGSKYEKGDGVRQDWEQAYAWYKLAGSTSLRDAAAKHLTLEQRAVMDKAVQEWPLKI